MDQNQMHVVFGTGQVGQTLANRLAADGFDVRAASRHRPRGLSDRVDWRAVDASDPEAATEVAQGASVIYQCLSPAYTEWPKQFPPLQRGALTAAEKTGALLVSFENVYAYGPTGGVPMTETHALSATTVKGRTRAAMTHELLAASESGRVRIAIGRASDFFGPGVTQSSLGERVFANALAGQPADFTGDPALAHTYSYVPDIAAGLQTLGTDDRAVGHIWHLPGPETVSTNELLGLLGDEVGHEVSTRIMPVLLLRGLGLVSPMMKALAEMAYEFQEDFVLDTTKFTSTFGESGTPLRDAIGATVAWYRNAVPAS